MPILDKKTGEWKDTPREAQERATKQALKDKNKGRDYTKLTGPEKDEIFFKMAKDLGYLE